MALPPFYNLLSFHQEARWYHYNWSTKRAPIPIDVVRSNSANIHLLPDNQTIYNLCKQLQPNQKVLFKGLLVSVQHKDGWGMKSSLSRTDSGAGACEVLWVKELVIK